MPRPHEYARMLGTGRPAAMVDETTHEWQVIVRGGRPTTVRVEANGDFHGVGDRLRHRSVQDAARAHARREITVVEAAAARRAESAYPSTGTVEEEEDNVGPEAPSGP